MSLGGIIGGVGSIVGGIMGSNAAEDAAAMQAASARQDRELQRELYYQTREDLSPYRGAGSNALAALEYDLGLRTDAPMIGGSAMEVQEVARNPAFARIFGDDIARLAPNQIEYRVGDQTFDNREDAEAYANANLVGGTPYEGFRASPGYEYRLQQGQDAIEASAAARGMLRSGGTLTSLQEHAQNTASSEYANHIARLMGMTGIGQQASAQQVAANQNYGQAASNTYAAQGNALAAGAVGQANSWNNAINNLTGLYAYENAQGNTPSGWWN